MKKKAIKAVDARLGHAPTEAERQMKEQHAAEVFDRFTSALCEFLALEETPSNAYNAFSEAATEYYNNTRGITDIDHIRALLPRALKMSLDAEKPEAV